MKRIGNLYEQICSWGNIEAAYMEARRGKASYREVKWMDTNLPSCLAAIKDMLENETYEVGEYIVIERIEGRKLRRISKLPFFPDRIIHHALLRVVGEHIRKSYIRDTFQSIPGRGTSDTRKRVRRHIREYSPKFFLQLDIRKYYPSVDHDILKNILSTKIKCPPTLRLFHTIIDSHPGLPIGNYTSQDLGNLNLTPFDWFVKQTLGVKGYFRYCDDLVFFGDCVEELKHIKEEVTLYLEGMNLEIKEDYSLQPLDEGLDFVGYVFYPTGVRLRETIYDNAVDALEVGNLAPMASYYGWLLPTKHNKLKVLYENTFKRKKAEARADS